jgi:SEC-C motif domain protein
VSCVCGVGESTETCCLPVIRGTAPAKTAEALMRSRYAAYVLHEVDHLMASIHPDSPGQADRKTTEAWAKAAEWKGIEIVDRVAGGEADSEGVVEFKAKFEIKGVPQEHHERARFKRQGNKWFYFDGDEFGPEPVRVGPRIGRNDPCPCGSGKKYKKCFPNCPKPVAAQPAS